MKKFRTITTVGVLACVFIFAVGIFTADAFELCWQDVDLDIWRLDFLAITSGNWLLNGVFENAAEEVLFIVNGNGRIVGTDFIAHLSGSVIPTPLETEFQSYSGTLILDLTTGATTLETIGIEANRITEEAWLDYDPPEPLTLILCPSP
jgi:hypothetical protein